MNSNALPRSHTAGSLAPTHAPRLSNSPAREAMSPSLRASSPLLRVTPQRDHCRAGTPGWRASVAAACRAMIRGGCGSGRCSSTRRGSRCARRATRWCSSAVTRDTSSKRGTSPGCAPCSPSSEAAGPVGARALGDRSRSAALSGVAPSVLGNARRAPTARYPAARMAMRCHERAALHTVDRT